MNTMDAARRGVALAVAVLSTAVAASCSRGDTIGAAAGAGGGPVGAGELPTITVTAPADVQPNAKVIPQDVAGRITATEGSLLFAATDQAYVATLHAGDVLVSDVGEGFAAKVDAVSPSGAPGTKPQGEGAGGIVIRVVPAHWPDIFQNIDLDETIALDALKSDASGAVVASEGPFAITLSKATFSTTPSVRLRAQIVDGVLRRVSVTVDETSKVEDAVEAVAGAAWSTSGEVGLWKSPSIPIRFVLGGVPIITRLSFELMGRAHVGASGAISAEIGATCTGAISGTVNWTPELGYEGTSSKSWDCARIPPQVDVQLAASAGVGISLGATWRMWGAGKLVASVDAGVEASMSGCPAPGTLALDAKVALAGTAELAPFGVEVGKFSKTFFEASTPLASGDLGLSAKSCCGLGEQGSGETACGDACCAPGVLCADASTSTCAGEAPSIATLTADLPWNGVAGKDGVPCGEPGGQGGVPSGKLAVAVDLTGGAPAGGSVVRVDSDSPCVTGTELTVLPQATHAEGSIELTCQTKGEWAKEGYVAHLTAVPKSGLAPSPAPIGADLEIVAGPDGAGGDACPNGGTCDFQSKTCK